MLLNTDVMLKATDFLRILNTVLAAHSFVPTSDILPQMVTALLLISDSQAGIELIVREPKIVQNLLKINQFEPSAVFTFCAKLDDGQALDRCLPFAAQTMTDFLSVYPDCI